MIKSHICVLQTTLALLSPTFRTKPYTPYIIADCVSSHNAWEVPIALAQMRQEGARVATSESLGFQLIGNASSPHFKAFSKLVKESKEGTAKAGAVLISGKEEAPEKPVKNAAL